MATNESLIAQLEAIIGNAQFAMIDKLSGNPYRTCEAALKMLEEARELIRRHEAEQRSCPLCGDKDCPSAGPSEIPDVSKKPDNLNTSPERVQEMNTSGQPDGWIEEVDKLFTEVVTKIDKARPGEVFAPLWWASVFSKALSRMPTKRESGWLDMKTAPRDGSRIQLLIEDDEVYHGWYEDNFNCFMGMDAEWNLWKLGPTGWKPLPDDRRRG